MPIQPISRRRTGGALEPDRAIQADSGRITMNSRPARITPSRLQ
jgi:hypothetical protein